MNTLFHILPTAAISPDQDWYAPPSFEQEGFIHCSFFHQVVPTANRHYVKQTNLSLLEIDPAKLTDVRVENLYGGQECFPHIYERLPLSAVRRVHPINPTSKGNWLSPESAFALFDTFAAVDLDTLAGLWQGYGFPTGHPLDGLLETVGWYGKEFVTTDEVHPLLFSGSDGYRYKISPNPLMMQTALQQWTARQPILKPLFELLSKPLRTTTSQAHLRNLDYRGKVSATMIYDHLPIHDVFRQVDANTLMGWMNDQNSAIPFFFVLCRTETLRQKIKKK